MLFRSKKSSPPVPQAAARPPDPATPTAAPAAALEPAQARQRADQSHRILGALGAIATVQMHTPHLRARTMADLEAIVVPAVATGQFSIAEATHKQDGYVTPVAYLLWGSFSAEVDRELSAAPDTPFPSAPREWRGGDVVWIVEAAGDQNLVGELIRRQREGSWNGRTVRIRAAGADGRVEVSTLSQRAAGQRGVPPRS